MINTDIAARIKACQNVYSLSDTARHFGVSKDTVHRIWSGKAHTGIPAALEPPNVISRRVPTEIIIEDGRTLIRRGMSMDEAARAVGVSRTTLYNKLKEDEAPSLMVFK